MKKEYYIFILLLVGAMLTSCKKSNIEFGNTYEKSYKTWQSFKESSNNSYRYMVSSGSWTGASWQTIITVKSGKVVERSFTGVNSLDPKTHEPDSKTEWVENEGSLNTHTNAGAPTLTLDEIYAKAKNEWLIKRKNAKSYFETNNGGMISSCGYVEDNCADDCFIGITVGFIEKL